MKRLAARLGLSFAILGYCVAIALYFAPARWHLPATLVSAICPPSLIIMISMTDPSFSAVAFFIAPLNALIYGIPSLLVGLELDQRSERKTS